MSLLVDEKVALPAAHLEKTGSDSEVASTPSDNRDWTPEEERKLV
jgi:hypothetical protein